MRPDRRGPSRPVVAVVATAVVALVLVGVGAAVAGWALARVQTRQEAQDTAQRIADLMVGPLLTRALDGDVQAGDELRRFVALRTRDGSVRQITVWSAEGAVVFSSDPALVGRRQAATEELAAAARGTVSAEIADSDDLRSLAPAGPVVEVYVPLRARPGLVLETYGDAAVADRRATVLALPILAVALVPLVLLQLLQSPVLLSLVRRVRAGAEERSTLLEEALTASERERREIAAGLHDTVVQDLAGVGYVLEALRPELPGERRPVLDETVDVLAASTDALRRLMLELHPPELTWPTLPEALERLAAPLREDGIAVTVRVEEVPEPDHATTVALYRIARECLVNVVKHARAGHVRVAVGRSSAGVRLEVVDDGIGVDPGRLDRGEPGHFGTALIRRYAADLGGTSHVGPAPAGGTVVQVEIPGRSARRRGSRSAARAAVDA